MLVIIRENKKKEEEEEEKVKTHLWPGGDLHIYSRRYRGSPFVRPPAPVSS